MNKIGQKTLLNLAAVFIFFTVIGFFLSKLASLMMLFLLFILSAGLIITLDKRYWENYGIPVIGLIVGYIIQASLA